MTALLKSNWEVQGALSLEDIQKQNRFIDTSMAGISRADRNGAIVSSTVPEAIGKSVADRDYFKFHQSSGSGALHIGQPLAARFKDKAIITLSRRLSRRNGSFDGIIIASTGTPLLAEFANESMLGTTGILALVGLDGVLRAAKIGSEIDNVLHPAVIRAPVLDLDTGFLGISQPGWFSDNDRRYLASAAVPGYPLRTIVGLSERDVLRSLQAAQSNYLHFGIAGACLLALFALVSSIMSVRLAWKKHLEETIRATYRIATEGANEGFYMWRPVCDDSDKVIDYEIVDCNERGAELYGSARKHILGSRLGQLCSGELEHLLGLCSKVKQTGFYEDEVEARSDSAAQPAWIHRRFVLAGDGIAVTLRDISERKRLEHERHLLAEQDSLTELPNRHWLGTYLPLALASAASASRMLAVLFIDLDRFKQVNDSWGHSTGDKLLHAVAERMRSVLRPADKVARFGGDEFIVLLEGIGHENDAAEIACRIAEVVAHPFHIGPRECLIGASIGISLYPKDGADAEVLIRNADIAMYNAKSDPKTRYRFFSHEFFARIQGMRETERELAQALEADEFVIHYQPRVDALSGALLGLEALVRWNHPMRGLVYPADFIPVAESSGLIVQLGQVVMEKVCLQLARWRSDGLRVVPVSVNASADQFNEGRVNDLLACYLDRYSLPASLVEIELTESIMVSNGPQVCNELTALRNMGVSVHLDDFGTGYSSLSMLHQLDVDVLKVDRAFTSQLGQGDEGEILFKAIISMARALGMRVVAEGVETVEQLRLLQQLGCDEVQGYLIAKPLPASEIHGFNARSGPAFAADGAAHAGRVS